MEWVKRSGRAGVGDRAVAWGVRAEGVAIKHFGYPGRTKGVAQKWPNRVPKSGQVVAQKYSQSGLATFGRLLGHFRATFFGRRGDQLA